MRIDYSVMHRNLKICLTTGETLYGKAYCDGQDGYVVYEMFGGKRREIPAAAVSGYAPVREEDLGVKVRQYEDLEKMCGEDPVFHMRVMDFALDILSEVFSEKESETKGVPCGGDDYKAEALKVARERAEEEER